MTGADRGGRRPTTQRLSRSKRITFTVVTVVVGLGTVLLVAEGLARLVEPKSEIVGPHGYEQDPVLGWLPPVGRAVHVSDEFEAVYEVNAARMNDVPVAENAGSSRVRIMALGDSHTYAVGVSQQQTWPNVLETRLFDGQVEAGTVYNLAVIGFSVGQYLLRMEQTIEDLRPQLVLIGFSMATDLYDVIPPRKGGFIYGSNLGRVYFDLDEDGGLLELHDLEGRMIDAKVGASASERLKYFAGQSALYRRLKRSDLALWIAMRFRPEGRSLWPGMDTALKIQWDEEDAYRWKLVEAILARLSRGARANGAQVVLVSIPYIAQVYDEVWAASFGSRPDQYDRWIAGRRLTEICERAGIHYLDTTGPFVEAVRDRGRWLHFPKDAHPTPEGHELIAEVVHRGLVERGLVAGALASNAP